VYPTAVTPWFKLVPQLEKIPLLYADQLEASTATDTGPSAMAFYKAATFPAGTSVYPDNLNGP